MSRVIRTVLVFVALSLAPAGASALDWSGTGDFISEPFSPVPGMHRLSVSSDTNCYVKVTDATGLSVTSLGIGSMFGGFSSVDLPIAAGLHRLT